MYVNFNILNQLGSPSINSNTFANRPAAGQTGRLFVSTDTFEIYRDNGTTWDLIGGPGAGTITGSGTATQVAYFTGAQTIGSSANLFWDNTNTRLGIGTATPGSRLDIHGTGTLQSNNSTGATNNNYLQFQRAGANVWRIGDTYNGGTNFYSIFNSGLSTNAALFYAATNKGEFTATETIAAGLAIGTQFTYNLTVPNATTFGSPNAITALGMFTNMTLQGNSTVPIGTRQGLDASQRISFTTAGTMTVTQGGTVRAFSNISTAWSFAGTQVGTVTHLAGMRIVFPDNIGSAINVTNNYGILINNQTTGLGTVNYTNRWGIYQEGSSDLNYFAANMLLGSTTNSGERLQVTGQALFTGAVTGTGNSSTYTVTAASGVARSKSITSTLVAAANNDVLAALDINPTFTTGAFTGVNTYSIRSVVNSSPFYYHLVLRNTSNAVGTAGSGIQLVGDNVNNFGTISFFNSTYGSYLTNNLGLISTGEVFIQTNGNVGSGGTSSIRFFTGGYLTGQQKMQIFGSTGNVLIQTGGTITDAGFKLDVQGTLRATDTITSTKSGTVFSYGSGNFTLTDSGGARNINVANGGIVYNSAYQYYIQSTASGNYGLWLSGDGQTLSIGDFSTKRLSFIRTSATIGTIFLHVNQLNLTNSLDITTGDYSSNLYGAIDSPNIRIYSGNNTSTAGGVAGPLILQHTGSAKRGNVLIGTSTNLASAIVNVESTTQGFLPPRMTTAQKNAIAAPAAGLTIYDTTLNKLCVFTGVNWETVTSV